MPWAVGLGIAAVHLTLACVRYASFDVSSWDLGIFTQVVNDYAHFRAPVAPIHGVGFNVLGDHFSPALAVLAPLFWIWQSPVMLLIAQAVAFGWSAVPITRLAQRRLGATPGLALGVAYGLSTGLLAATAVDFHEIALAVPLLAYALVAVVEERWRAAVWFSLPLLLVKEDLGLTVAAIGLVIALRGQRRIGALLAACGILGSIAEIFVLIPLIAPDHRYPYFSQYDGSHANDSLSAVWRALAPSRWRAGFSDKVHTLAVFGWATVFMGWGSSLVVIALPTLGWRFISAQPAYWGTSWHYDAVLMPIVFVAAIEVCEWLAQGTGLRRSLAITLPAAMLTVSLTFADAGALGTLRQSDTWQTTPTQQAEQAAVEEIPSGTTVLSDLGVMSHLAARDTVYWLGTSALPDYIVTVDGTGWTPPDPSTAAAYWSAQYSGHQFGLVSYADGVTVLRREG